MYSEHFRCINCGKCFHYWGEDAKKINARLIVNDIVPTLNEMDKNAECCEKPNILWI